jgi:hypothetical protein
VEAGSNTSTVTLRVVGGDEKGSLKTETLKYGGETQGTWTRERLRWRGPAAYTKDRPVRSSERAPHKNKTVTVKLINIWSCAPDGLRHQDLLIDRPSVAMQLWLWLYHLDLQSWKGGQVGKQFEAGWKPRSKSKLCYDRRSVGQSVLVSSTHLGLTTRFLLLSDSCGFVDVERSRWRENRSAVYNCCWSSPAQSFSRPSLAGLVTIFYCFRFEAPSSWRVRSPCLYTPGTEWLALDSLLFSFVAATTRNAVS